MYNSRYLMYEQTTNSKYAEYGQVTEVISDKLFNVAMSGESSNVLEAVTAQSGYIPKVGDWVTISWLGGSPVGAGGSASNGLQNVNDNITVASQTDVASGTINGDHIRVNSINADHITANAITAQSISANSIYAYHLTASSVTASSISANSIYAYHLTASSVTAQSISANSVSTYHLSANSVTADKIAVGAVTADSISANSITSDKISADSITSDKISANTITAQHMQSNSITTNSLSANSITSDKILSNAITSDKIDSDAIVSRHISSNVIQANMIQAQQIQAYHLSANSVTADAISSNSIRSNHIVAGAITTSLISANSIVSSLISSNQIMSYHISSNQIDTQHISAGAITADKIASNTITAQQISANSITSALISAGAITTAHISAGAITSQLISANAIQTQHISANSIQTNQIQAQAITTNLITANAITSNLIESDAIQSQHISANAILSNMISANQIQTQHISSNSITASQITTNAIQTQHISANSISTSKIQAGAITTNLISANSITSSLISSNSILASHISSNQIQTQHISANSIKTSQIQAGAITSSLITANAITSNLISANSIQSQHISANSILSNMISANQVQTQHISANSINANQITANAIQTKHISAGAITTPLISAGSITTNLITANAITSQLISANQIQTQHISANSVTASQISANSIQTQHISANTITGQQIKANTITGQNISAGTITGQLISANTITGQQISGGSITTDLLSVGARKSGLLGQYYTYTSANTNKFSVYKGSQVDQTIDFNWTTGSPSIVGQSDYFAIRWQGYIVAPESGTFTFKALMDDTVKVIINNSTIINQVSYNANGTTGTIQLVQDQMYPIVIEYTEGTGSAQAHLYWTRPSGTYEIVPSMYMSQGNTIIDGSQISTGSIQAGAIAVGTITAESGILANAVIQTANIKDGIITSAKIGDGEIQSVNIASGNILGIHIASEAVDDSKIKNLSADKISGGFISGALISGGTITGQMIAGQTISGGNIKALTIDSNQIKGGAITADKLSAGSVTADAIVAGAVTAESIQAGAIESYHISTVGLDANVVSVYNKATGQTLIDGGYLNVGGLDVGVVQSDNLVANGMLLTASSSYGFARNNPTGNILLGSSVGLVGANQLWKYDLSTGQMVNTIDITAQQPYDIAIHPSGNYAYVTAQGNDTLVQVDLVNDAVTDNVLDMGTGPARAKFTGMKLMDMKHVFVLNTDANGTMLPDSLTIVDTPPDSVDAELYIHHQIALGTNPVDIVVDENMFTWITLGTQGEVVMIDTSQFDSANWKVKGRIPISAFGTDNYHGGLPAQFGLQEVTGGDASSQYNDNSMASMSSLMSGMDAPSGYGASDGSLRTYAPHGIELSSDPNTLYVLDNANGQLVVVDKNAQAPYDALIGSGPPNSNQTSGNSSSMNMSGGSMNMSSGGTMTSGGSMNMTGGAGSNGDGDPAMFKSEGEQAGGGPTTPWVRYRISVGDSPEFMKLVNGKLFITVNGGDSVAVIDESAILSEINADNEYYGPVISDQDAYANWNIMKPMRPVNTIPVRTINNVGAKPFLINENGGMLYVSLSGQNQIAVIDPNMEMVTKYYNTGANPKGFDFTPDGKYMYVANFGGESDLSFVYPEGPYIGDAFLGLEGGVEYQGADHWTPNRSDWVYDSSGNVQSQSTVEFRINEPFLNEGGYVILSAVGQDAQWAQIEQDITEVTNYSNGNNTKVVKGEIINAYDSNNTVFKPKMDWLENPAPTNIMVATPYSGNFILASANVSKYTINYGVGNSSIVFSGGVVPSGGYITVDYTGMYDVNFMDFNGSVLIANENGSSPNFSTLFEVDEFVPNFVVFDNRQTSDFTPTWDGINDTYSGLEYSMMTNRALNIPSGNITSNLSLSGGSGLGTLVDGMTNLSGNYVGSTSGNQYVQLDLGMAYMIGMVTVWHYSNDSRTYHGTKTEVSEDGVSWTTVFDSHVSGEYVETSDGHMIMFDAKPVRYVRDWLNGSTSNSSNHWVEIQAFGDWEVIYDDVYPDNSTLAGQQIATNGKSYVSTDISGAYVAVDIQINFTTWWYMTYIVGPDFGKLKVDMPTLMNSSHYLELSSPYVNKIAHRHLMSYPPSEMIPENDMMGIKAGKHRARIVQVSGRITFDRFRFEDYQLLNKTSVLVPADTSATVFRRQKALPHWAKWYVGQGTQTTEGAYDSPRVNDQGIPDGSVPIKYRFRVKAVLNADGTQQERGIAYATSMIFEQGKAYTSWRMSNASDIFPGNKVETWDSNLPFKTGIQNAHLADGAVTGLKIMTNSIMDYHINNYARIQEHKLELNHPTHQHGYNTVIAGAGPMGTDLTVFNDNLSFLDELYGWAGTSGNYGSGNYVARGDHLHDDRYLQLSGGTLSGNITTRGITATTISSTGITVTGNITVTGTVDGVDVSNLSGTVYNHIGSGGNAHAVATDTVAGFMSASDKTKLDGIQASAISQSTADGRYLKLAGGTLSGNITLQNDGLGINFYGGSIYKQVGSGLKLKAHADSVGVAIQNTSGNDVLVVKTDGTGMTYSGNTVWHSGNVKDPATVTWVSGNYYNSATIDSKLNALNSQLGTATESGNGLMSSSDKTKLDGIQSNAINQTTADNRYLQLAGGNVTGNINITNSNSYLNFGTNGMRAGGVSSNSLVIHAGSGGVYIRPNSDADVTGQLYIGGSTLTYGTNNIWHEGNLVGPATQSWVSSNYYNTATVDQKIASSGDIHASGNNVFRETNTFNNAGLGILIQPSANVSNTTKLLQVNDNLANELFSVNASGGVVIKGDFTVSGTQKFAGTTTVDGDYSISGNLYVTGSSTLGDAQTDTTTVNGTLVVNGSLQELGKYVEVHRRPLYGIAGDLEFRTSDITADNIGSTNYNPTTYANPPVQSGATRYYRVYVVHSNDINSTQQTNGQKAMLRLSGNSTGTILDFQLNEVWGDLSNRCDYYTPYFTNIQNEHIQLQAYLAQTGNAMSIRWVELIAYDRF